MDDHEAVVSIDFGTSNIGFAFSFKTDRDAIYLATNDSNTKHTDVITETTEDYTLPESDVTLFSSYISQLSQNRVPTVLLLNADGTINAFGKLAVDRYAQLVMTGRHQGHRYFDMLKMELNKTSHPTLSLEIQDKEGRKMSALVLFSLIIRYVGKLALQAVRETVSKESRANINPNSVLWVLPIPAIWSDAATQFFREAAIKAGIPRERVRLTREPEAASVFWKKETNKLSHESKLHLMISAGKKYIIAHLGGGTVDVCAYEILSNEKYRELFQATGNNIGGMNVDDMFIQLLMKLVGFNIWKTFHREKYFDFVKLMRHFEETKRKFDHETKVLSFELPFSLIKLAEQNSNLSFGEIVQGNQEFQNVFFEGSKKLCVTGAVMASFFKPSVEGIVNSIKNILQNCCQDRINTLLLSGGYSMSPYVEEAIKREFLSMEIIKVSEQDLAVMKGAVMVGYESVNMIERRARYTYGFAISRPFKENVDPKNFRFIRDGKLLCRDFFHKVISKNQLITAGDRFTIETRNNDRKYFKFRKRDACAQFFISTAENPIYCTEEEGCKELFTVKVEAPVRGWPERLCIDYVLLVGDNDFEIWAFDKLTGCEYCTRKEQL